MKQRAHLDSHGNKARTRPRTRVRAAGEVRPGLRIGIDVGGTFTDLMLVDERTGKTDVLKIPSTPLDPSEGIVTALRMALARAGLPARSVNFLAHGTTVTTNAVLEGKLADAGLITTAGYRDILEIGRQTRQGLNLYDFRARKADALVPRRHRLEVNERLLSDGSVLRPLDLAEVQTAAEALVAAGCSAIAICFLHSYLNPVHERAAAAFIRDHFPNVFVSVSHEVSREYREFERFCTTALDASLLPVIAEYIRRFRSRLTSLGTASHGYLMQSSGGLVSLKEAEQQAVKTLFSGPSAGVIGAVQQATKSGRENLITFDMGGTSTDVCLVVNGKPSVSQMRRIAGYPVRTASLDVHSIGAGGGSIARVDAGGLLKVGPQSAGAVPGPACYGRGGEYPTVTDANVLLGRVSPDSLLDGEMPIKRSLAYDAIRRHVADPLGVDPVFAASGILRVVAANMMRAVRVVSIERGFDPRNFALVAFGGAGPQHAAALAGELSIPIVIVPESPGILCAAGLLGSENQTNLVRTRVLLAGDENLDQMVSIFAELEQEGQSWLQREGIPENAQHTDRSVDMRYRRQNYELTVPISDLPFTPKGLQLAVARFHELHRHTYGTAAPAEPVQLVSYRLTARDRRPLLVSSSFSGTGERAERAQAAKRLVYFDEVASFIDCPIRRRDELSAGDHFAGPLIVEQMDATTVVPPGQYLQVDQVGNLVIGADLTK